MSPVPAVTVIIPVYDDQAGLDRCLQSLAAQTVADHEVLVVDNGARVSHRLGPDDRARLLHEPTPGSYAARNRALREARASVLAFTDADCVPRPDWLEQGLRELRAHPEAGLVAGDVIVVQPTGTRPTLAARYDALTAFDQRRFVLEEHFGVTANLFAPRSTFDRVGPFDASRRSGGDVDLGQRVHRAGLPILFCPAAVVEHPPRTSLRDVLHRTRRLHAGSLRWQPGAQQERRRIAWWVRRILSGLAPPAAEVRRLRQRRGPIPASIILVAWLAKLARLGEDLRLLVGGEAPR